MVASRPRSLLSVADLSSGEIDSLISRAGALKKQFKLRRPSRVLSGSAVGLLFEKPSTRTRTSFEVATLRLGGSPVYLAANDLQLSRGEPIKDTARVLGGYLDVVVARVFAQSTLVQLATYSGRPVINALSETEHPTQAVSDLLTIKEVKGKLRGTTLAYIGDGNNVCNSLLLAGALTGMNVVVASPEGYEPEGSLIRRAKSLAKKNGGSIELVRDPRDAVASADAVYTDVWVSMGEEREQEARVRVFKRYQVNSALMKSAPRGAVVMHCLPAHRGLEITDDVL
ncbi:MAG: ornithine carbamoyltransferase, partial [Nitrososphaerota archaeon]|nr:ornithine carbamoyltransferase [Nitrososphaerota archaeon]